MLTQYPVLKFIKFALVAAVLFFNLTSPVLAGPLSSTKKTEMEQQADVFRGGAGYDPDDMGTGMAELVATVIEAFLGLLGLIFVILIIIAGFNWMTASGEAAKIDKAKQTITRAIIGLVIIVSAYAITYFVFQKLDNVGSVGGSESEGGEVSEE